jgi:hypothetical protein
VFTLLFLSATTPARQTMNRHQLIASLEGVREDCPYTDPREVAVWNDAFCHTRATIAALAVDEANGGSSDQSG